MARVNVKPELLSWACERVGLQVEFIARKKSFAKLPDWLSGKASPTLKQIETFARVTRTPVGYFFLPEPPEEPLPIRDFRSLPGRPFTRPSPDLLDTVYTMQRRQAWLRERLMDHGVEPLDFVGSARLSDDPEAIGREMRRVIGLSEGWASQIHTWQEAVSELRRTIEHLGIMAVINGVVGNNTYRKLNVKEFRGFALCDDYAPLIFINGSDAKSAQMFSLAHELCHIWLGPEGEGLSGFTEILPGGSPVEEFCDKAAAEFLLPAAELKKVWPGVKSEAKPFESLARRFKISPIVVARRALDLRLVDRDTFFSFYYEYIARERKQKGKTTGGDYYHNQNVRVGETFAMQVISAAKEGQVSFKEAYELTGLHGATFTAYAKRLGINLP